MANYEMLTNQELTEQKNYLINEFEAQKNIIANAYNSMLALQKEYEEVENIINKRQGNV